MIVSRTPFRISFFGGGTDYPVWYQEHGGAVLSTTINKYCYISCRYLPPFFEHRSRIVWSQIERVKNHREIQHPAVRECLDFLKIEKGVEIHHDGDLPARSGLGSSSSFTVGLLHALYALKGVMPGKKRLAEESIYIEQHRLKENVGSQDQIAVAYGGFNRVNFYPDSKFDIAPVILPQTRIQALQDHMLLFFSGFSRMASEIAKKQIAATPKKTTELNAILQLVDAAVEILSGTEDLCGFGNILHDSWLLKRSLTDLIATDAIDDIYQTARSAGALGGKVLGAGGGGFMLFFVKPEDQEKVKIALKHLLHVPFQFDNSGSQIIFYDADSINGQ